MRLAKPSFDIGLTTNAAEPVLAFWRDEIGLPPLEVRDGPGMASHRFDARGSKLKVNANHEPQPDTGPSGYRRLLLVREGLAAPADLRDADGNPLRLLPPGHDGIGQAAVEMGVRSLEAHRRFYAEALGLPEEAPGRFRVGESLVLLEQRTDAPADAQMAGLGWRYITFQVHALRQVHAHALDRGAREAVPPTRVGDEAVFSMIRDPDGNWIELAQQAALTGTLD